MPILGAHVSAAGGVQFSIARALDIGCGSFQIFTRNQRRWESPQLKEEEVSSFRELLSASGLDPVLAHGSYLINLGAPDPGVFERSVSALMDELVRCSLLGIPYLVIHPGSHLGSGTRAGSRRIVEGLDMCLARLEATGSGKRPMVLLETTAGQGTSIGSTFEELGHIREGSVHPEMIGICMDTCHLFAAGYDISTSSGHEEMMDRFDDTIGLDRSMAVHLNDSMKGVGSRVDRHANIGEGKIGPEGFALFMRDPRLKDTPMILETPGGDEAYRKELSLLRSLAVK
ncbi:MAG: deoxyribonuclease IV [Candidatus Thermoplasmatota archaeon]|nr:deoxyribonuclease IV [Candidatus Thermoplasmatota archaeon]